jgi:hypothetical protein
VRDPVNVGLVLDEGLDGGFAINRLEVGVEQLGKRLARDQEVDRAHLGLTDEQHALALGEPLPIAHLEAHACGHLTYPWLGAEGSRSARAAMPSPAKDCVAAPSI